MKTTEITTDLAIELREGDDAGDIVATGYGRAVPYNDPTDLGGLAESFAPNAFEPDDVIGKPFAYRHGEPIGVITGATNERDGLYIDFQILNTTQGRDAATLMRNGASKGLSVGFTPVESVWNKAKTAVQHTRAKLLEVSQTHMPAYATAGVSAVREEQSMSEVIEAQVTVTEAADSEAREQIAQLREEIKTVEAKALTASAPHPASEFRSFGEYVKAVYAGQTEYRALDVSNLADAAGLVPPIWLRDVKGRLDYNRDCIQAIGGPSIAAGAGLDIAWPYFDGTLTSIVAAQSSEGAEVNSVDIDIKKGTATLVTYASANRLTYQIIERTDPSYVDQWMRIQIAAYAAETDYAFQAALWANDTAGVDYDFSADTTGSAFLEAVWSAAVDVKLATGAPAEVVYVNTAVYKKLAAWSAFQAQNYPVQNVGGAFDGRTVTASVMGLPIVHAPEFATDETEDAIVTNRAAIGWAEEGPRMAQNDVVGNLSRDYAIYGYGVATPFIPAGIIGIYNQA